MYLLFLIHLKILFEQLFKNSVKKAFNSNK